MRVGTSRNESNSSLVLSHDLRFGASFLLHQMYGVGFVNARECPSGQFTVRGNMLCLYLYAFVGKNGCVYVTGRSGEHGYPSK